MDLSKHLASTQSMDCTGRVTHRLTLLPDGTVEVDMGAVTAVVNPATKTVIRPVGFTVPGHVLDQAGALAREALG